jgi:16S rRNA C967 or C1407 C5-methylase (RsmB/RsmF family)
MKQKQNTHKEKLRGAAGFELYYAALFGGRWDALKLALAADPLYVEWKSGGCESYYLDGGSVSAALSLPLAGAKRILDMCAAPGGKSLVLASLMDRDAILTANERSPERKNRLIRVCDSNLPEEIRKRVIITCGDGARLCLKQHELYDCILLDAPCSSERHVLADEKYLSEWTPSRIKTLAIAQWALLSSAYRLLRNGGFLLYSTCALSLSENDDVVLRLLQKFSDVHMVRSSSLPEYGAFCSAVLPAGELTVYGRQILPDVHCGAGPLYYCLIQKNATAE